MKAGSAETWATHDLLLTSYCARSMKYSGFSSKYGNMEPCKSFSGPCYGRSIIFMTSFLFKDMY